MFKKLSVLLSISFIFAPANCLKRPLHAENVFKNDQADRYFEATLFEKAIDLYRALLNELHANTEARAHARLQLAKAYYFVGEYEKIPEVLAEIKPNEIHPNLAIRALDLEGMLLTGLSYNKMQRYDEAVVTLLRFLALNDNTRPFSVEEGLFELGLAYFQLKQYEEAKKNFLELREEKLIPLSRIYLARIAIAESNFPRAETLLQDLKNLSPSDFLSFAFHFLQGEILFHQEKWEKAVDNFESALSFQSGNEKEWMEDTLFYIGWCHLHVSENPSLSSIKQKEHFERAEEAFRRMIHYSSSDRAILALGQTLLLRGSRLSDPASFKALETLLSHTSHFHTREAKHHALLLRAEASNSYSERKRFFKQLTNDAHWESPFFPTAWYLSGLNELDEGQRLTQEGQVSKARKHLEESVSGLKKSFDLFYPHNKTLSAKTIKYLVHAYSHFQSREGYLKGLALLSQLLNQYRDDLFILIEEPDEIYYLQGQIASQLLDSDEEKIFFTIAENSLTHCIESYPKGKHASESLMLLGTLYYQKEDYVKAERIFLSLAQRTPPSLSAGEAWHWAANCVENRKGNPHLIQQYRKKVFENYPQSAYADEAYFRYYTLRNYTQGVAESISHLQAMPQKFPHSPYLITAYYLIGLNTLGKSSEEATEAFQKAVESFKQAEIPKKQRSYFAAVRTRSLLEQADAYLTLGELEKGEMILSSLCSEFNQPDLPPASLLSSSELFHRLQEESAYKLAQCEVKKGDDSSAIRVLNQMIEKYQSAKITRGYYLSRVWYEKGLIASRQLDPKGALQCFHLAEDAAKGKVLNTDELLDLWIQQSLCHESLEEMDEAMLILSKVINYDAVSSERLKAMYLRAQVYEKQGRVELARRQLEATAKKGGPWAQKAKTKLENYD